MEMAVWRDEVSGGFYEQGRSFDACCSVADKLFVSRRSFLFLLSFAQIRRPILSTLLPDNFDSTYLLRKIPPSKTQKHVIFEVEIPSATLYDGKASSQCRRRKVKICSKVSKVGIFESRTSRAELTLVSVPFFGFQCQIDQGSSGCDASFVFRSPDVRPSFDRSDFFFSFRCQITDRELPSSLKDPPIGLLCSDVVRRRTRRVAFLHPPSFHAPKTDLLTFDSDIYGTCALPSWPFRGLCQSRACRMHPSRKVGFARLSESGRTPCLSRYLVASNHLSLSLAIPFLLIFIAES